MIALFCGSRHWTDREAIATDMLDVLARAPEAIVLHGGATGADTIAGAVARQCGLHVIEMRALWDHYGRSAGPRRNAMMLRLQPEVVYAYTLGGNGTRSMINLARDAGVPVIVRTPAVAVSARGLE